LERKIPRGLSCPYRERIYEYDMPIMTAVISSAKNSANTYFILNGPYPCCPEEVAGMFVSSIPSETHLSK
jgi:hypothetical protein